MIKRETLKQWKWTAKKFGYHGSVQREQTLIDSHLEALDEIDDLQGEVDTLRDLANNYDGERRLN